MWKALKIFMLLSTVIILGLYIYITNKWRLHYTTEEVKSYALCIDTSPALSATFYAIHDKLYNNSRHKTIQQFYIPAIVKTLLGKSYIGGRCWVAHASQLFAFRHNSSPRFREQILAFGIQKYTTPEKCFDFCMYYQREMLIYYQLSHNEDTLKSITQLTDTTEILEFLERIEGPRYYRRHEEKLLQRVSAMKNKLSE